ncbi:MAG: DUF92 domain-containing protein [Gemmatimonadaceae bacterium]
MTLSLRLLAGAILASLVALAALRAHALSRSGSVAAFIVGTAAVAAGWAWAVVLLAFFLSSSALSRWRKQLKDAATRSTVEKGGARDAWQVFANGGVFTVAAVGQLLHADPRWGLAAVAALAAATADTWATEVGTAIGGQPRRILDWHPVLPGTSGAVSVAGTVAMCAGAAFVGTVAATASFPLWMVAPVIVGGIAGALFDTVAGATIQERRWCRVCQRATERRVHDCGTLTTHSGGIAHMANDVVNLTSCITGACVALAWWSVTT